MIMKFKFIKANEKEFSILLIELSFLFQLFINAENTFYGV